MQGAAAAACSGVQRCGGRRRAVRWVHAQYVLAVGMQPKPAKACSGRARPKKGQVARWTRTEEGMRGVCTLVEEIARRYVL